MLRGTWLVRSCAKHAACFLGRPSISLRYELGWKLGSKSLNLANLGERLKCSSASSLNLRVYCCLSADLLIGSVRFDRNSLGSLWSGLGSPCAAFFASSSAISLPWHPRCAGIHRLVSSILVLLFRRCLSFAWNKSIRWCPEAGAIDAVPEIDAWLSVYRETVVTRASEDSRCWAKVSPKTSPSYTVCSFAVPRWNRNTRFRVRPVASLRSRTADAPIPPS